MQRISQAIALQADNMTKGQRILAAFVGEHCEKAAFMTSFELASATGLGQSTVVRFATMLGYKGYSQLRQALQYELKYRLDIHGRRDILLEMNDTEEIVRAAALADCANIKKLLEANDFASLQGLAAIMLSAPRVFVYGQGFAAAAAIYLGAYLKRLLPSVDCLNLAGLEPLTALGGIKGGDLLLIISFPLHSDTVCQLADYALGHDAVLAAVTEAKDSKLGVRAKVSLVGEFGDFGINGSLAPVISLCAAIVCVLAKAIEASPPEIKNLEPKGR